MRPFTPSPKQWPIFLSDARLRLWAGGEGSGKSRGGAQDLFGRTEPGHLYWLAGLTYDDTLREFEYLLKLYETIGAVARFTMPTKDGWEIDLRDPFPGATIRPRLAADEKKISSWAPRGTLVCEAAKLSELAFSRLKSRIRRGQHGWMLLTGTFEGSSHWYADTYELWQTKNAEDAESFHIATEDNLAQYPLGSRDPEILALRNGMTAARFSERHLGLPVPPETLVHPEFNPRAHVGHFPFEAVRPGTKERWPVELAIDPGHETYAVLAIQKDNDTIYVRDCVYAHPPMSATERVLAECKRRPWWPNVNPTGHVIDFAGRQHMAGESQVEIWARKAGLRPRSVRVRILDGIDRLATLLRDPARETATDEDGNPLWPDSQLERHTRKEWSRVFVNYTCGELVKEFRRYRYGDTKDFQNIRPVPIDAHNHAVKALAYYGYATFGPAGRGGMRPRALELSFTA